MPLRTEVHASHDRPDNAVQPDFLINFLALKSILGSSEESYSSITRPSQAMKDAIYEMKTSFNDFRHVAYVLTNIVPSREDRDDDARRTAVWLTNRTIFYIDSFSAAERSLETLFKDHRKSNAQLAVVKDSKEEEENVKREESHTPEVRGRVSEAEAFASEGEGGYVSGEDGNSSEVGYFSEEEGYSSGTGDYSSEGGFSARQPPVNIRPGDFATGEGPYEGNREERWNSDASTLD